MARDAALWLLATSILSILLAAGSVLACWTMASRCTRDLRRLRARLSTPPSDVRLAKVETDLTELFSILGKLNTTTRRLSSRAGMQDLRAREAQPETKDQVRRRLNLVGLSGPEIARRQLSMNVAPAPAPQETTDGK